MKALASAEFYEKNWDKYIKDTSRGDYMNFEAELEHNMEIYKGLDIPAEELKKIDRYEAQKIADKYTPQLKETMKLLQDVKDGRASLGYTTQTQENLEMRAMHDRFEFNCYQLSVFKRNHIA